MSKYPKRPFLKACPFCGASPHWKLSKIKRDQLHGDAYQDSVIECPHLCCRLEDSPERVAERWNARLDNARLTARVEELEGALERAQRLAHMLVVIGDAARDNAEDWREEPSFNMGDAIAFAGGTAAKVKSVADDIRAILNKEPTDATS